MVEFKYIFVNWVRCSIATCLFAHYLEGISGFSVGKTWLVFRAVRQMQPNNKRQHVNVPLGEIIQELSQIASERRSKVTCARKTFNHMKTNEKMSHQGY